MDEFRLIERIRQDAANAAADPALLTIPPGDDMAALKAPPGELLLAVDQVVEGRHFDLRSASLEQVAHKAVHRCLSDVAAMAGRPLCALYAVVFPAGFDDDRARTLGDALHEVSRRAAMVPAGGDIASHDREDAPLVLSVTILGLAHRRGSPRRGDAEPGDRLVVTGALGGSLEADGGGRHLSFEARVPAAQELRDRLGSRLGAMIDLSDGLGRDAGHLARASDCVLEIDAAAIPARPGCTWRQAAGDGEDHELLFTVREDALGQLPDAIDGLPLTVIGRVLDPDEAGEGPRVRIVDEEGRRHDGAGFGWVHR